VQVAEQVTVLLSIGVTARVGGLTASRLLHPTEKLDCLSSVKLKVPFCQSPLSFFEALPHLAVSTAGCLLLGVPPISSEGTAGYFKVQCLV